MEDSFDICLGDPEQVDMAVYDLWIQVGRRASAGVLSTILYPDGSDVPGLAGADGGGGGISPDEQPCPGNLPIASHGG